MPDSGEVGRNCVAGESTTPSPVLHKSLSPHPGSVYNLVRPTELFFIEQSSPSTTYCILFPKNVRAL